MWKLTGILAALAVTGCATNNAVVPDVENTVVREAPDALKPKLDPVKTALVVTCMHQLALVAVVFEDGTFKLYDKQSGVPSETALYTAAQAETVYGFEACDLVPPGEKPPSTDL